MLILSLEINLGEIGVKVEKFEHGIESMPNFNNLADWRNA